MREICFWVIGVRLRCRKNWGNLEMGKGVLLVIGASGDVGQGIVAAGLASGRKIVAAGRDQQKLDRVAAQSNSDALATVAGDISTEAGAKVLWEQAVAKFGNIDNVVVSVNAPNKILPLMDWSTEDLTKQLIGNVVVHFIAARVYQPLLPESGQIIGIGGGTADFIIPGMTYVSMGQAALRMMYKGLARERKSGAEMREMMIVSMVAGESNRSQARPEWITDNEVGRHVCAILDEPEKFSGAVLCLKSREQVGLPET